MKIRPLSKDFSICKVCDFTKVNLDSEFCFTGNTDEEKSVVCLTEDIPDNTTKRDDDWRGFRIEGILDFSLVGILARISALLAEAGIGIFVVSTFNTDYIFVKREDEEKSLNELTQSGYEIISDKIE